MEIAGKRVLITGANRGLGQALALACVRAGAIDTDMTRNYDIPKTSPSRVAEEILEAIKTETRETAVSDDARKLLSDLAADPVAVEEALSQIRA